jgi:hypothetical protein
MKQNFSRRLNEIEKLFSESKTLYSRFNYYVPHEDKRTNNEIISELVRSNKIKSDKKIFIIPSFNNEKHEHGKIVIMP